MKPTQADFAFWAVARTHGTNAPKWAQAFKLPVIASVHGAINSRGYPKPTKDAHHLDNLLHLLTLARKNMQRLPAYDKSPRTLRAYIAQVETNPGYFDPKSRSKWCARILRGMKRAEARAR
jgi:hypothetical protein